MKKTIEMWAGTSSTGTAVYEQILVEPRGPDIVVRAIVVTA